MSRRNVAPLELVEAWSARAFLLGGSTFVASAAITVVDIGTGAEQLRMQLGQAFVGAGWTAGTVGLLGLYRGLVDRSPRLVRAAAGSAILGLVGYVLMTVHSLALFAGAPEGALEPALFVFLPAVFVGTVAAFPLFGIASLRAERHTRTFGWLLFGPTLVFLANVATPTPAEVVLVVLVGLVLLYSAIGHLLSAGDASSGREDANRSSDPAAD